MNFHDRCGMSVPFEKKIEDFLESRKEIFAVCRTGVEHRRAGLKTNHLPKAVRFAPDGMAVTCNNQEFYWEAKAYNNKINIEKDAYETYMQYYQHGRRVVIFFGRVGLDRYFVHWQDVQKIKFLDSRVIANRTTIQTEIDSDGWIRFINKSDHCGSGTPFKEVLPASLNHDWDNLFV